MTPHQQKGLTLALGESWLGTACSCVRSASGPSQQDMVLCFGGWWMSLGVRREKTSYWVPAWLSQRPEQQQEPLKRQGKQLPGYAVPVFNSTTMWPREAAGVDAKIGFPFNRLNYSKAVLTTALSNSM